MRARRTRDVIYLPPLPSAFNASAAIAAAFARFRVVYLLPGTHLATSAAVVPTGKTLIGLPGATFKLADTSTATDAVTMQSSASLMGLRIDANIVAREAAGFSTYTHGIRATNRRDVQIRNCTIVNAGEADAYGELVSCGILVERTQAGTETADGIVVSGNVIEDPAYKLAFGIRMRTDFTGITSRAPQPLLKDALVSANAITGTMKNGIEIVGPDTTANVIGNTLTRPAGQGGMEFDFGATGQMIGNLVRQVGRNGVQERTFDAFSVRCGEFGDGSGGLRPVGARMEGNRLEDSQQVGDFFLRLCVDFGAKDTLWLGMSQARISKAAGAAGGRRIAYAVNAKNRPVKGIRVVDLSFTSTDIVARITDGTQGFSDLAFTLPADMIARVLAETPALAGQTFIAA